MTDTFIVILPNKSTVFARTESGRIFDITNCEPVTDSKHGINYNGVLPTAKQVTSEYVAELLSKRATLVFRRKKKTRRRAISKANRRHHVVSAFREEAI